MRDKQRFTQYAINHILIGDYSLSVVNGNGYATRCAEQKHFWIR